MLMHRPYHAVCSPLYLTLPSRKHGKTECNLARETRLPRPGVLHNGTARHSQGKDPCILRSSARWSILQDRAVRVMREACCRIAYVAGMNDVRRWQLCRGDHRSNSTKAMAWSKHDRVCPDRPADPCPRLLDCRARHRCDVVCRADQLGA